MRRRARSNPSSVGRLLLPVASWRHSAMRPTRRLLWASLAAYSGLHPRGWPFQRSHLRPQRVISALVAKRLLGEPPQPPHRHIAGGRVVCSLKVSAPEPSLSACASRRSGPTMVDGISSALSRAPWAALWLAASHITGESLKNKVSPLLSVILSDYFVTRAFS